MEGWFDQPQFTNHTENLHGSNHADYPNHLDLVIHRHSTRSAGGEAANQTAQPCLVVWIEINRWREWCATTCRQTSFGPGGAKRLTLSQGEIMKKLLAAITTLLLLMSFNASPVAANSVVQTTVKILSHEGAPVQGARISINGIPQVPQSTNASGETRWTLAPSATYSMTVQTKATMSRFTPTSSFFVSVFVPVTGQSEHVIRLPKVIKGLLSLSDSQGFESNLLPVSYSWAFTSVTLEVNGKALVTDSERGGELPSVLEVTPRGIEKVAEFSYFEPSKLTRPSPTDLDGDLIPDHVLKLSTPYGSTEVPLASKTFLENPPSLPVANLTWVKATPDNEGVSLSLMQGDREVTSQFPNGVFSVHLAGPYVRPSQNSYVPGVNLSGARARFASAGREYALSIVFGYSVNGVSLGISSVLDLNIRFISCMENKTGFTKASATLGSCPTGWTSLETLRKLSDKRFSSCAQLNRILVGGVGRSNAVNFGKRAFKGWLTDNSRYAKNRHLDTDRDGIACER